MEHDSSPIDGSFVGLLVVEVGLLPATVDVGTKVMFTFKAWELRLSLSAIFRYELGRCFVNIGRIVVIIGYDCSYWSGLGAPTTRASVRWLLRWWW